MCLAHDVGEADDGVQRRPQFVAHIGQEGRFGEICRFGAVARRGRLEFAALAVVMSRETPMMFCSLPASSWIARLVASIQT